MTIDWSKPVENHTGRPIEVLASGKYSIINAHWYFVAFKHINGDHSHFVVDPNGVIEWRDNPNFSVGYRLVYNTPIEKWVGLYKFNDKWSICSQTMNTKEAKEWLAHCSQTAHDPNYKIVKVEG